MPSSRWGTSLGLMLASLVVAYAPLPGFRQTLVVVSGTELEEPLKALESEFEAENPSIDLALQFQGSQDMVNRYVASPKDFPGAVMIPANGNLLMELEQQVTAQGQNSPFVDDPMPVVKTRLVAVAWPERGQTLFPQGQFRWSRLTDILQTGRWESVGADPSWGSFDLGITDPSRSNSGQLALGLWLGDYLGEVELTAADLQTPQAQGLLALVKRSLYLPPRSTDSLLQDFITKGVNDADVAIVYESIALARWAQAQVGQPKPYQIYYLNPTVETVSTAAILAPTTTRGQRQAARSFLQFLQATPQQERFVAYGFRPAQARVDLTQVPDSPWSQQVPGAQVDPVGELRPEFSSATLGAIVQAWEQLP